MKIIFSIARNEFRYLFYSPIAWFALLVFLVQFGYQYSEQVYTIANLQEVNLKNVPSFKGFSGSLTQGVFLFSGLFSGIAERLFIFIPLLTMGLINRDHNSGSHALLYSSPVSVSNIVMGKYVGIMLYNLLLLLVVAMFVIMGMINIRSVDYGPLLSALLGFYLLICAYSAIGMFMSSLTNSQILSGLITFLILSAFTYIGSLWQKHDVLRDLTWFLSAQNRLNQLVEGLIVTRDLIYYILLSSMFIIFTYFRLSGKLEFRPWPVRAGRVLAVIAVVLLIGYAGSRPALTGYLDTTATKRNTIHPKLQEALHQMGDSTLEVTLYTNILDNSKFSGLPHNRNSNYLGNFWDPYLRFKPGIKFKYVYYYGYDTTMEDKPLLRMFPGKTLKEIARDHSAMLEYPAEMFLPENGIQPAVNLQSEGYRLVMQLKYRGRTAFLRTFQDDIFWPNEIHVIAALKRVLGEPVPGIAYSTGHLERSVFKLGEREYGAHTTLKANRGALINLGFDIDSIDLQRQAIPRDLAALVIADPKIELNTAVQEKIKNHIDNGGNLMVNGEPGKQYVLNPLLSHLGLQLEEGQLVYPTYDETPDKVIARVSEGSKKLSDMNIAGGTLMMPGATSVIPKNTSGWETDSLAYTLPGNSWLKKGTVVIDSILPPFNPLEGDRKLNSFTTLMSMKRTINGKEQKITVSGDADYASGRRISRNNFLLMSMYSWMADNRFPIRTPREDPKDLLLSIGERFAYYQKLTFTWILPSLVLIAGAVLLIRRKRK